MTPQVTIVIATYNRCDVLARVLRCVRAQTFKNWTALIIGDACTDDTQSVVNSFSDHRMKFINLPVRFGEQSGPNSVGIALADTPLVAFLNHDDYWLPNHLQDAVDQLKHSDTDVFWARAAFFTNRGPHPERPMFTEVSPVSRSLEEVFDAKIFYSEPMSAWLVKRETLVQLGSMTPASQSALTPLLDYCARAYRAGAKLKCGSEITVLKDRMHLSPTLKAKGVSTYSSHFDAAEEWVELIESGKPDKIHQLIEDDIWLAEALGLSREFLLPKLHGANSRASIVEASNIDLLERTMWASRPLGWGVLGQTLKNRTGEVITNQPDLSDMIEFAKNSL